MVSAPLYDYIIIFYLGGTYVSHFFIAVHLDFGYKTLLKFAYNSFFHPLYLYYILLCRHLEYFNQHCRLFSNHLYALKTLL